MRSHFGGGALFAVFVFAVLLAGQAMGDYCTASGDCDEYIYDVYFSTRHYTHTDCTGYIDTTNWLGPATFLSAGQSYHLAIVTAIDGTPFTGYEGDNCGVWIDWNQDEDFYDVDEQVLSEDGYGLFETTVTVPAHALEGTTRMRVRLMYTGYGETLSPCGNTEFGEVEDFALNILPQDCNTQEHETASYSSEATSNCYEFNSSEFMGCRFHIDQPTQIMSVGGHLAIDNPGNVFAAIISLLGPTALPLGDPFYSFEIVGQVAFNLPDTHMDFRAPLWLTLGPGDYALVFGSGILGASPDSSGLMPSEGQTRVPGTSYITWRSSSGWSNYYTLFSPRFVVECINQQTCDTPTEPVNPSPLDTQEEVPVDANLSWSGYSVGDELVNLYYTFKPVTNTYEYSFDLRVDQLIPANSELNDIIFFDDPSSNPAGTVYLIGSAPYPFTKISYAGGIHNGPFLDNESSQPWVVSDIGEHLVWKVGTFNFVSPVIWSNSRINGLPISFADAVYGPACQTKYDVYFGTVNPPTELLYQDIDDWSCDAGALDYNQQYYWQVAAKNDAGTTFGPVWSFTTAGCEFPSVPVNPIPYNGVVGVPVDTVLMWKGDTVGECSAYDVYFGTDNPPATLIYEDLTEAFCEPGTLDSDTTYYWQVINKNYSGEAAGPVWSFTTIGDLDTSLYRYKIIDLGTIGDINIPGYNESAAYAINDFGDVAGGSSTSTSAVFHAFYWEDVNENGQADVNEMQDLGVEWGTNTYSVGYGINNVGDVVGSEDVISTHVRAFIWEDTNDNGRYDAGEIYLLEMLPVSSRASAFSVNDDRFAVGSCATIDGTLACLWEVVSNTVTNLGTLGGINSEASFINNTGQVVGWSYIVSGDVHGFVWSDGNGNGQSDPCEMLDIGTLGGDYSRAYSINNAGQVVGVSKDANGAYHAFFWKDSNSNGQSDPGEMSDLGHLGGNNSRAICINDSGCVVGYSYTIEGEINSRRAFYWDSTNGLKPLFSLVCNPSGWQYLVGATGINNRGQIAGMGYTDEGENHAFLMTPVPQGDLDCDVDVDMSDFAILGAQWRMEKLPADVAPYGGDGIVNFLDWAVFAADWDNTRSMAEVAEFVEQWLQQGAGCADMSPDGGDGIVDEMDLAVLAENWLADAAY